MFKTYFLPTQRRPPLQMPNGQLPTLQARVKRITHTIPYVVEGEHDTDNS